MKRAAFLALWCVMSFGASGAETAVRPGGVTPMQAAKASMTDERIRVQFSAQRQTVLSAELSAKLIKLPLREGDAFKSGQILADFDCAIQRAQLNKADASAEAARQTLEVNRRLAELGSISNLEVEQSVARLKETRADAAAVRVMLEKCTVTAPFGGRVAKVHVDPHQFVAQGKPLVDIVDTQRLEVRLLVPSKWLSWMDKGTRFVVRVEELDRDVTVVVTGLGARIDPVSQTIAVVGEPSGATGKLLPGMSGWAVFVPPASN